MYIVLQIKEVVLRVTVSACTNWMHLSWIPGAQPGDFVTKVKQINSQSDLIWMTRFADPSYLTVRSSVYIILI